MGRIKSFLQTISIDIAKSSHSCKHDKKHSIKKGDKRLKLRVGRASQHFCTECAKASIETDINKLKSVLYELGSTEYKE